MYLADILGQMITKENSVDWLQLFVNICIALITLWALLIAIKSSQDTAEFSRITLEEAQENRKDDVMPVLQMSSRPMGQERDKDFFYLKNVGQGPLFEFKIIKPKSGILRASPEITGQAEEFKYYIAIDHNVLLRGKKEGNLVYSYLDMYGRRFEVNHKVSLKDGYLRASGEIGIPKKVS